MLLTILAASDGEVAREEILRRVKGENPYYSDQHTYDWTEDLRKALDLSPRTPRTSVIGTNRRKTMWLRRDAGIRVDYDEFRDLRENGRHKEALALVRGDLGQSLTAKEDGLRDLRERFLDEINASRYALGHQSVESPMRASNWETSSKVDLSSQGAPAMVRTALSPQDYRAWIVEAEARAATIDRIPKRISVVFKDPGTVKTISRQRFGSGSANIEHYVAEHQERRDEFFSALERGMRCREIYRTQDLLDYVMSRRHASATLEPALIHKTVLRWREAIATQENYIVGLTNDPLPFKYEIISASLVVIHEAIGIADRQRLNSLFISGADAVRGFVDDFEIVWDRIDASLRDRETVVDWIDENLVPLAQANES